MIAWKLPDTLLAVAALLIIAALVLKHASRDSVHADDGYGIGRAIATVQRELEESDSARIDQKKAALFTVKNFDLELNFVVREASSGEAGADLRLVTVGGKHEYGSEKVQKLTLHMEANQSVDSTAPPDTTLK